jgi:hypothetical protein
VVVETKKKEIVFGTSMVGMGPQMMMGGMALDELRIAMKKKREAKVGAHTCMHTHTSPLSPPPHSPLPASPQYAHKCTCAQEAKEAKAKASLNAARGIKTTAAALAAPVAVVVPSVTPPPSPPPLPSKAAATALFGEGAAEKEKALLPLPPPPLPPPLPEAVEEATSEAAVFADASAVAAAAAETKIAVAALAATVKAEVPLYEAIADAALLVAATAVNVTADTAATMVSAEQAALCEECGESEATMSCDDCGKMLT